MQFVQSRHWAMTVTYRLARENGESPQIYNTPIEVVADTIEDACELALEAAKAAEPGRQDLRIKGADQKGSLFVRAV